MRPQQFQRVLLHTRFELDRFEAALARLKAYQFPSDVARTLIDVQKRESEKAAQSLRAIEEDFAEIPPGPPPGWCLSTAN